LSGNIARITVPLTAERGGDAKEARGLSIESLINQLPESAQLRVVAEVDLGDGRRMGASTWIVVRTSCS
jgi:hypothetical protein